MSKGANKTTVIIPNYNGMRFLSDCLEALQKQAHFFEIIVVDNGSKDESVSYLKENFPIVKIIELPDNTGFCHAVNVGIKAASTPYVILLNNDTVVRAGFVKKLEESLTKKPNYFSIGAKMLCMDNPDILDDGGDFYCALGWAFSRGKGKPAKDYNNEGKVFAACAGAAIYRRDVFSKIGFFDENHFAYLEDIDIGYRAKIYGYENGFCPEAQVYHIGSGFSGSRYNEFKVKLSGRNNIYLIGKNMPILQLIINSPFLLAGFLIKILFFYKKGLGNIYIKGLIEGIKKYHMNVKNNSKIPFRFRHLKNYFKIQIELWYNMILRIKG